MRAVGIGRVRRLEGFDRGQLLRRRGGQGGDFGVGDRAVGAGDADMAVGDFQIGDRRLQFVRGELLERGGERLRGARRHDRADGNRARAAGAVAAGDAIGVALHDLHPFQGNVEILRNDLRIGRLVPLPVRLRADQQREIAVLVEREGAFFALAPRGAFDIARHADPANEPALSRFLGARAEARDVGFGEAGAHRALEVADVVIAVGLGAVGHLAKT